MLTGACQFGHGLGGFTINFIHSQGQGLVVATSLQLAVSNRSILMTSSDGYDDDELLVRASTVLKGQGQGPETGPWSHGRPGNASDGDSFRFLFFVMYDVCDPRCANHTDL